jgi:hypothetical protein
MDYTRELEQSVVCSIETIQNLLQPPKTLYYNLCFDLYPTTQRHPPDHCDIMIHRFDLFVCSDQMEWDTTPFSPVEIYERIDTNRHGIRGFVEEVIAHIQSKCPDKALFKVTRGYGRSDYAYEIILGFIQHKSFEGWKRPADHKFVLNFETGSICI